MFGRCVVTVYVCVIFLEAVKCNCRDSRSSQLRMDGGLCFEIPPWQHQPVEVEKHLNRIRNAWGNSYLKRRQTRLPKFSLDNREVNRYMDTVIAPFLDTYHRNIQNSYQQLTNKILKKIKDEINVALRKKHKIYTELTELADSLKVPDPDSNGVKPETLPASAPGTSTPTLTMQCTSPDGCFSNNLRRGLYRSQCISRMQTINYDASYEKAAALPTAVVPQDLGLQTSLQPPAVEQTN